MWTLKFKGRDTRCDKSQRHVAPISRLVCTVAATSRLPLFCRCDMSHEFKPVWICATDRSDKFCRSDNDFHFSHEAICCSNLSRRRVASCASALKLNQQMGFFLLLSIKCLLAPPADNCWVHGYEIPEQSSDMEQCSVAVRSWEESLKIWLKVAKKRIISIELWTLESSYNIERHGKQQLTYLKVTLCYVFINQLHFSCQAHRCIKTAFNSSEAYSFSGKTVNTRENFWSFHNCFVTNQMRDETTKGNCQAATWISRDLTQNNKLAFSSKRNLQFYCFQKLIHVWIIYYKKAM